jgi:hypothetical protein
MVSSSDLSALSVVSWLHFYPGHDLWFTVMTNGFAKESQCGSSVASGSQQESDGVTCDIDDTIQVFPRAFDFDVSFIYSLASAHGLFMPTRGIFR